jgi:phenylacetate-coenzyme A ligase PaaK-like adenylate-forming protein
MQAYGLKPELVQTLQDIGRLPVTTKSDIAANFPDRITDTRQQFKPWRYRSSSGTIERLTVIMITENGSASGPPTCLRSIRLPVISLG